MANDVTQIHWQYIGVYLLGSIYHLDTFVCRFDFDFDVDIGERAWVGA